MSDLSFQIMYMVGTSWILFILIVYICNRDEIKKAREKKKIKKRRQKYLMEREENE